MEVMEMRNIGTTIPPRGRAVSAPSPHEKAFDLYERLIKERSFGTKPSPYCSRNVSSDSSQRLRN